MNFLIITENKDATSNEVFHPLMDAALQIGEQAHLIPIKSKFGVYHEFQIGSFEPDSLGLVVTIPEPKSTDEVRLVFNENYRTFDQATELNFDFVRLALFESENEELIFNFCKAYLGVKHDHQICYEGMQDCIFNYSNISSIDFKPGWYTESRNNI